MPIPRSMRPDARRLEALNARRGHALAADLAYGALLDAIHGVRWSARRVARGVPVGAPVAARRDHGAEPAGHGAYRVGESVGRVDWTLYARRGRLAARLSQERAIRPTVVVLDASASMAFPSAGEDRAGDKWELARCIAVALASVAHAGGDPTGLVVPTADGLLEVTPRTRQAVVGEIARQVSAIAPRGAPPVAPAFVAAMRRGSRVVLLSDFLGDNDALCAAAARFTARGGELHAVHLMAAEELDPPASMLLVCDPEQPAHRRAFGERERAEYQASFASWRERLARQWRGAGAWFDAAVTGGEPVEQVVRRIVSMPGRSAVA